MCSHKSNECIRTGNESIGIAALMLIDVRSWGPRFESWSKEPKSCAEGHTAPSSRSEDELLAIEPVRQVFNSHGEADSKVFALPVHPGAQIECGKPRLSAAVRLKKLR